MPHRLAAAALAAAAVTLTACDIGDVVAMGPEARQQATVTRRLDPQGTLTVENTNGAVIVETWSEASVSIETEKVGPEGTLDDMRVDIDGEGNRVDVRTRYDDPGWGRRHGRVEYRIKVPEGARVEVETTNGAVRVSGTGGALRAETTNGSIEIADAGGSVEAATTNGSIRATFRRSPRSGEQRFNTTNGAISVTLPDDASGEFEASTVNGGISSDFPLQVSGRIGGRRLRGRLGEGAARFELRTVNGGIRIGRRPA
jgi:DUF4097 and DUF4098 domain-containing protein YvlB